MRALRLPEASRALMRDRPWLVDRALLRMSQTEHNRIEGEVLAGTRQRSADCRQTTLSLDSRAWLFAVLAASLALRWSLFDFESGDYRAVLSRWYDFFVEEGAWQGLALKEPRATYPPFYLYLISLSTLLPLPKLYAIKVFSVAADYIAAWYIWRLARWRWMVAGQIPAVARHDECSQAVAPMREGATHAAIAAIAIFLFLPTVVMNSAFWGQCDMMYTTGFVASLCYLVEARPVPALVAFGFSCALKPQAIFWCPLLAGLFISRRLPWKWLWVPVAVYAACGLPAIFAGKPVWHVIWPLGQVDITPGLNFNVANVYQWVGTRNSEVYWAMGVGLTLLATELLMLQIVKGPARGISGARWLVTLALMSVLFPPFLLPGMHDRYFFPADVLSLVYAFYVPRGWRVAVIVPLASVLAYFPFLFGMEPAPLSVVAVALLGAIFLVAKELVWPASSESRVEGATS